MGPTVLRLCPWPGGDQGAGRLLLKTGHFTPTHREPPVGPAVASKEPPLHSGQRGRAQGSPGRGEGLPAGVYKLVCGWQVPSHSSQFKTFNSKR